MSAIADVIARLHTLPSPRGVALELMRLAQRENTTVKEVVRVLQADPALAGRLIHAANRLNGGRTPRTGSLGEAVLRLGFSATREIALGFSLVNDYRSGYCTVFDYPTFWTESLLRGLSAQAIASRVGGFDPQEAFVCGLLADIGRLALATAHPRDYAELLVRAGNDGASLSHLERERFGADHTELGVALLEHWNLPEALVRAVSVFHAVARGADVEDAVAVRKAWIMVLAQALAQAVGAGAAPAWKQVALDAAARLALDTDALNVLAADMLREASAWTPLLDLPAPAVAVTDYRDYESPPENTGGAHRPLDILLVDDSEDDRDLVRHVLEGAGHRVLAVASGSDALAVISSRRPELVITDWDMPGMNGIDLCRALRATRMGRGLYLIMYTGHGKESDLVAAIEAGADDFMSKPISSQVLLARVNAARRSSRHVEGIVVEFRDARLVAVDLAADAGQ